MGISCDSKRAHFSWIDLETEFWCFLPPFFGAVRANRGNMKRRISDSHVGCDMLADRRVASVDAQIPLDPLGICLEMPILVVRICVRVG